MLVDKVLNKLKIVESDITIDNIDSLFDDWIDTLKGGIGDNKLPSDFDKEELLKGVKDEMEHTNNPHIALEIAIDHLTKEPNYYSKMGK